MKYPKFTITLILLMTFSQLLFSQCWKKASSGGQHSLAIMTDGSLWAWGANKFGQLGNNTTIGSSTILQIGTDADWKDISAGSAHNLALKTDGSLWAWGSNMSGELGDGTNDISLVPKRITKDSKFSNIAVGASFSVAIKDDGTLWAWGANNSGQLGDGTTINKSLPIQIGSDNDWKFISCGMRHVLALKNDGSLWAWGSNNLGAVGKPFSYIESTPTRVGSSNDWQLVSAGSDFSMALKQDGTSWTWGLTKGGGFGEGNYELIKSVKNVSWATIEANHYMGIKDNGTLWTWGEKDYSQSESLNTKPVQILNENNWVRISASWSHSLAIKTDGTLWAWGQNHTGQLGDGTNISRTVPVQIGCQELKNSINYSAVYDDSNMHKFSAFGNVKTTYLSQKSSLYLENNNKFDNRILGSWRLKNKLLKEEGTYSTIYVFTVGNKNSPILMTTFYWNSKAKSYVEENSSMPNIAEYRQIFSSEIGDTRFLERYSPVWDGELKNDYIPRKYEFLDNNNLLLFPISSAVLPLSTQFSDKTEYRKKIESMLANSKTFLTPIEFVRVTNDNQLNLPESNASKEAKAEIKAANDQLLGLITLFFIGSALLSDSPAPIQNENTDRRTWGYDQYGNPTKEDSGSNVYYDAHHNPIK